MLLLACWLTGHFTVALPVNSVCSNMSLFKSYEALPTLDSTDSMLADHTVVSLENFRLCVDVSVAVRGAESWRCLCC